MTPDQHRILIIQGHPDSTHSHFCHALADAYGDGARSAGHSVQQMDVGKISFPMLRSPDDYYNAPVPESLEPVQEAVRWANHLVIIFPLWMGTAPALFKGFLEQVFRPGFAYENKAEGFPEKKLSGRSARIVITMGMPALAYRYYYGAHGLRNMKRNMLGFIGMSPIRDTLIGGVEAISDDKRKDWLEKIEALGKAAR